MHARDVGVRLVPSLFLLAACTAEPAPVANPVTVRDSAGVTIVESAHEVWSGADEAWRVDPTPLLAIGVPEGEAPYLLDRVAGATRLGDGTIVVADGGSNQLRFFDASGRFVRAAGGKGGGPGEFEYLRELQRCGGADSLYAFDLHWRMKVFTAAGEYVRQLDIRPPEGPSPYQLACSPSGTFVMTGWGISMREGPPPVGFYRSMTPLWIVDTAGRTVATLGEHLGSERLGTMGGSGPHPFGRATALAAGRDAFYLGDGTRFEIMRHDAAGQLTRIQRAPVEGLAIEPAMIAAYREWSLAQARGEQQRVRWARDIDTMPMPDGIPAFTQLVVDADDHLWARRFRVPGDTVPTRWGVFAPDGGFLGHVTMPPRFAVLEIGTDYVLGVARDEEDVQQVRAYRLVKPRR